MTTLEDAISTILASQKRSNKPLAVILAGHNGSGKSTLWCRQLADLFRIPLVNADRMMMSILPEPLSHDGARRPLPDWASAIRDNDSSWMHVAQAMAHKVPFAVETVFSYWVDLGGGKSKSKVDLIQQLQEENYYVLLLFVRLMKPEPLKQSCNYKSLFKSKMQVRCENLSLRFTDCLDCILLRTSHCNLGICLDWHFLKFA